MVRGRGNPEESVSEAFKSGRSPPCPWKSRDISFRIRRGAKNQRKTDKQKKERERERGENESTRTVFFFFLMEGRSLQPPPTAAAYGHPTVINQTF